MVGQTLDGVFLAHTLHLLFGACMNRGEEGVHASRMRTFHSPLA